MPLAIPVELKKISPYIRRAEELDKDKSPESRLVAYYCRQYAVHVGIPISGSSQEAKVCLGCLLESLESEKTAMDNFTRDEAAFLCRKFANQVFDKADGEDRMGLANKNTAKTFYAASTFLQILDQFTDDGDTSEERDEDRKRIVYAKWKSTEILKAIKDGRTPTPGGYGETATSEDGDAEPLVENDAVKDSENIAPLSEKEESHVPDDEADAPKPQIPQVPPQFSADSPVDFDSGDAGKIQQREGDGEEVGLGPPPAYPGSLNVGEGTLSSEAFQPSYTPEPVSPAPEKPKQASAGFFGFGKKKASVSKARLADAVELTRFALAALEDKDVELGIERLEQALSSLR